MPLSDGLYSVEFQTPLGAGAGIIVLENGIIRGGDSGMFYVGEYTQHGNQFSAKVTINRHANIGGVVSVFGKDNVTINLQGATAEDHGTVVGTSPEAPGLRFEAKFRKLA